MKKYFLVLSLFFLPFLSRAQSIIDLSVDSAANDTSLVTSAEKIADSVDVATGLNQQLYLSAARIGKNYTLIFSLQTGSATPFIINPGNKVSLDMANGDVLVIANRSVVPSRFGGLGYGHSIKVSYALDEQTFETLLNNDVGGLRMEYDQGTFSFRLDAAYAGMFRRVCRLVE